MSFFTPKKPMLLCTHIPISEAGKGSPCGILPLAGDPLGGIPQGKDEGSADHRSSEPGSSPPEDKGEDNPLQHLPSLVE